MKLFTLFPESLIFGGVLGPVVRFRVPPEVPGGVGVLESVIFKYTASAVVAVRNPAVQVSDFVGNARGTLMFPAIAALQIERYSLMKVESISNAGFTVLGLSDGFRLFPNDTVSLFCLGGDAGDLLEDSLVTYSAGSLGLS